MGLYDGFWTTLLKKYKPAWLCFAAFLDFSFTLFIPPILRVLSFKVSPKCQFHFLVLQIITIPLLIRAVPLRHPSSPALGWAASSQVQTSQRDLCFLTSGNIVALPHGFPSESFLPPKNLNLELHPLNLNIDYTGFISFFPWYYFCSFIAYSCLTSLIFPFLALLCFCSGPVRLVLLSGCLP